jgi:hypothetical protein
MYPKGNCRASEPIAGSFVNLFDVFCVRVLCFPRQPMADQAIFLNTFRGVMQLCDIPEKNLNLTDMISSPGQVHSTNPAHLKARVDDIGNKIRWMDGWDYRIIYRSEVKSCSLYERSRCFWGPHSTRHRRLHSRKPSTFIDKNG